MINEGRQHGGSDCKTDLYCPGELRRNREEERKKRRPHAKENHTFYNMEGKKGKSHHGITLYLKLEQKQTITLLARSAQLN